jgi:HPt (histidine-containing phosphotransfer) domain-containing protein
MLKDGIDSLNKEVATFGASSVRLKDLIEQKIDSVESKELLLQMSNELQQQAELIHSLKGVGHNLSAVAQQMHEQQHAHNQSVPGVVDAMYEVQRSIAQTAMSLQQALQHAETPNYRSFFKRVFRRK